MLDTTRADVMSTYGGRAEMRSIDKLATRGIKFERAISPSTCTFPSHLSLFTGIRARELLKILEKSDYGLSYLDAPNLLLAEELSYLNYSTALFSNNPMVSKMNILSRGFLHYYETKSPWFVEQKNEANNEPEVLASISKLGQGAFDDEILGELLGKRREICKKYFNKIDMGASETNGAIKAYLNNRKKKKVAKPLFLFVNYMEPHEYYPTKMISKKEVTQERWVYLSDILPSENIEILKRAYIKKLEYLDRKIGELIGVLKREGALEDAVLIVSSDHGQAFMEDHLLFHEMFPSDEVIHVPLILARFVRGRQKNIKKIEDRPTSITNLHGLILSLAYGAKGLELKGDKVVFSDHFGCPTQLGDLKLLKGAFKKSEYARRIYKAKKRYNEHATAIFHDGYKLIHFYGKSKPILSMGGTIKHNKKRALKMLEL